MSFIPPHTTTLIFDIHSKFALIGYCGDFHPSYHLTLSDCQPESLDYIYKLLEKYMKLTMADSLIYLEPEDLSLETKSSILNFLFSNKIAQSVIFLNRKVSESFGAGKVTSTILSCTFSSISYATVINGKRTEFYRCGDGFDYLQKELLSRIYKSPKKDQILIEIFETDSCIRDDLLLSTILESQEKIDILNHSHRIDVFAIIKPYIIKSVEAVNDARIRNGLNKKNSLTGCILLAGILFKYDTFYEFVKNCLTDKIGADFSDFILRDKDLIYSFTGASIFGLNNYTKPMYITTHDWKSIGSEIIKLKGF